VSEMKDMNLSREPDRLIESLMENRDRLSRLGVLQALTDLFLDADSYEAARECIQEVLSQSEQLELNEEERGILLYKLGRALRAMAKLSEAAARADEAKQAFRASESREYLGKVELLLAEIAMAGGEYDTCLKHCMVALPLIESFGQKRERGKALRIAGLAHYRLGNLTECRRDLEEALEVSKHCGDVDGTGKSFSNLGLLFTCRGEWTRARECLAQALEIAVSSGNSVQVAIRSYNMGCLERRSGRWDVAEEYLTKSLDLFRNVEHPAGVSWALSELGILFGQKGDFENAKDYLVGARDYVRGHGLHREEFFAVVALSRALADAGRWQEALESLEEALATVSSHAPFGDLACEARTIYAECLAAAGRIDEAREQALVATELARKLSGRHEEGAAQRALGVVSEGVGAIQAFERSLKTLRGLGDDYEVALTLARYGEYLASDGDTPDAARKARSLLLEAHAVLDRLGAKRSADSLERKLAALESREGLFLRRKMVAEGASCEPELADTQVELESMGFVTRNKAVLEQMARWGHTNARILIHGETGTGKELIARIIHNMSDRKSKPYVVVDCASLSEGLAESELFGHVKGAYTNAISDRAGLFEEADGGTIFLDEVGELPPAIQAKLLRVLQEGEVRRVGSSRARAVDIRVIAATNRDLEAAVEKGEFRRDLYFRLKGATVNLPPLRERPEDIPVLVEYFVRLEEERSGKIYLFSKEALKAFGEHVWEGNVRELKTEIELLLESSADCVIGVEQLPETLYEKPQAREATQREIPGAESNERLVDEALWALHRHNGNKTLAAKELGITRQALHKRLKKLGGVTPAELQA
jgi:DNA-binding NtrC family response regulator/tetratricopeptide (TPR) repeat protein